MSNKNNYDYLINIFLIGDISVGKNSLQMLFVDNSFSQNNIGSKRYRVEYRNKFIKIENKNIKLQVWTMN